MGLREQARENISQQNIKRRESNVHLKKKKSGQEFYSLWFKFQSHDVLHFWTQRAQTAAQTSECCLWPNIWECMVANLRLNPFLKCNQLDLLESIAMKYVKPLWCESMSTLWILLRKADVRGSAKNFNFLHSFFGVTNFYAPCRQSIHFEQSLWLQARALLHWMVTLGHWNNREHVGRSWRRFVNHFLPVSEHILHRNLIYFYAISNKLV